MQPQPQGMAGGSSPGTCPKSHPSPPLLTAQDLTTTAGSKVPRYRVTVSTPFLSCPRKGKNVIAVDHSPLEPALREGGAGTTKPPSGFLELQE